MKLTVAYITGRQEPRLDWAVNELVRQMHPLDDAIDLIVVDALADARNIDWAKIDRNPFRKITWTKPKPTIWQGEHRVTDVDWWAMSNARNTAFCRCETEWIAFLDDRCIPSKTWLQTIRDHVYRYTALGEPARVLCGSYEKYYDLDTPEVMRVAVDNRFTETSGLGAYGCGGQWLYGCTFALPLAYALTVNGFEEGCDGLSAEDYIFGMMLANAGYKLDYDPRMMVYQDRSPGQENPYKRTDKGISPNDKSHAALARFGCRTRTEFTPDLTALRESVLAGGKFPIPDPAADHRDWFDGQPIREFR